MNQKMSSELQAKAGIKRSRVKIERAKDAVRNSLTGVLGRYDINIQDPTTVDYFENALRLIHRGIEKQLHITSEGSEEFVEETIPLQSAT
jgi:hypothetical protein